ncbi:MAG: lysophospholipid acyltransferase family protein [bacterium]
MHKRDRKPILYRIVSIAFRFWVKVFFKKIDVRHGHNIPAAGPVVFVANHPNSIMDGFVIRGLFKRKVNFIAHIGLFQQPFMGWVMRRTGNIPVYRRSDFPEKMDQNVKMFSECTATLEKGETIFIFPEGVSDILRKVKKIKTGAARIILEAEEKNNFELGVQVVPIGLHFYSRSRFHSRVLVNVGAPLQLGPFFEKYRAESFEAVRLLTDEIQKRLEELTVNVENEELDALTRDIESIYRDDLKSVFKGDGKSKSKSYREEFFISKTVADCVQHLYEENPERLTQLQQDIRSYKRKLKHLKLHDSMLKDTASQRDIWMQIIRTYLTAMLGFLPALYGIVNHYIPYRIANYFARHFAYERTKILTALFIGGGLAFNIFYLIQTAAVSALWGFRWGLVYFITLPLFGFYALSFVENIREQKENISFSIYLLTNKHVLNRMRRQRRLLIQLLDSIRDDYLQKRPLDTIFKKT